MKRWQWAVLIFELALFAVILILPQVDLPDLAFHGGTAPVAVKSRLSSPVRLPIVVATQILSPDRIAQARIEITEIAALPHSDSRLSLLCTLIC
jgi:hypothetical protein